MAGYPNRGYPGPYAGYQGQVPYPQPGYGAQPPYPYQYPANPAYPTPPQAYPQAYGQPYPYAAAQPVQQQRPGMTTSQRTQILPPAPEPRTSVTATQPVPTYAQKVAKEPQKVQKTVPVPAPAPVKQPVAAPKRYPGYIEPAERPTKAYIPPPKMPYKFSFDPRNDDKYANIYALLATIDALLEQSSCGYIPDGECKELTKDLVEQFRKVQKAVGFTDQNVKDFAEAAELNCAFAWGVLFASGDSGGVRQSKRDDSMAVGVNLGVALTSLADACSIPQSNVAQFQDCILAVRTCTSKMKISAIPEVTRCLNQWIDYLKTRKKSSDTLTEDERRRLNSDAERIRSVIGVK